MTKASSKFLVFDSKTGPKNDDLGLIYSSSEHDKVNWPKCARRGRPRKGTSRTSHDPFVGRCGRVEPIAYLSNTYEKLIGLGKQSKKRIGIR